MTTTRKSAMHADASPHDSAPLADSIEIARLNKLADSRGLATIFESTVIREQRAKNGSSRWWVMNRQEGGWSSSGRWFNTLEAAVTTYRVRIISEGRDECSRFLRIEPITVSAAKRT